MPFITDKLFVTNVQFSTDAKTYANYNEIELWDGIELEHMHYLMNIGRLNSEQEIVLNFSLPITVSYEQAIRRKVVNPYAVKVSAKLVLHPYFVFDYELDIRKGFLGSEKIHDYGTYVMDALGGEILYVMDFAESRFPINRVFSKDNKKNKDSDEALKDMEKNQVILDLNTIKPQSSYKIKNRPEDYKIVFLKDRIPIDAAERMVLDEIAEEKKVNENDIKVKKEYLVYVPKWEINFETIASYNKIYRREILAASNTILIDEIAYCPKDFFAKMKGNKKMTYAICEICGNAYCKSHIEKVKNSYYCKDHR